MRIVIDGRLWSESGLGRYIRNLTNELQRLDRVNEYYILLLKKDYDNLDYNLSEAKISSSAYHSKNFHKVLADFKWYGVEEQIKLPKLLRKLSPDLVHFPHFNVPIFYSGKYIVTIHDLIHQHHQTRETTTLNPILHQIKKMGYKRTFFAAVNKSSKIVTPSNFVKKQLIDEWGVKEEKIVVTYEGVDEGILRAVGKVGINKPYLFYVGNAQPHKNILRLIKAFGLLREKYPGLSLVLSGPGNHFWEKIKQGLQTEGVIFKGFVSEEEMVALYKNAMAFVMPSLEEGFGIPLLEAMACSCPVISSNAGSLPEIGGEAALYFNPKDTDQMAGKISQVLDDEKLRKELIQKGEKRYREFSWKKMAEETLEIYKEVIIS